MRRLLLCGVVISGCVAETGPELPPLTGESPILVDEYAQTVSLDTRKVPVVEGCPEGTVVRMGPDRWECGFPRVHWGDIDDRPETFEPSAHQHSWHDLLDAPETLPPGPHEHHWDEITGRPEVYPAAPHAHTLADLNIGAGDQWPGRVHWSRIVGIPEVFPPQSHSHEWASITGKPTTYPAAAHTHGWSEITGKPSTFTPSAHGHTLDDIAITDDETWPGRTEWSRIDGVPTEFPPEAHTHPWTSITGKPATYPPSAHAHGWEEITGKPAAYPPEAHQHAWSEITGKPATFPPETHTHLWSQIGGVTTSTEWPGTVPASRVTGLGSSAVNAVVNAQSLGTWSEFGTTVNRCIFLFNGGTDCRDTCPNGICYGDGISAADTANPPKFKKIGDMIYLRGSIRRASSSYSTGQVVLKLPVTGTDWNMLYFLQNPYKPAGTEIFAAATGSGTSIRHLEFRANGDVVFVGGSTTAGNISLSGIVYSTSAE